MQDLTADERDRYVTANGEALRAHLPADLVFANHVVLGGPVAAASGARYAVKAHGSELEYSMRGNEGLSRWGRESLVGAEAVFVGSEHIRRVLEEVVGPRRPRARRPAGRRRRRVRASASRRGLARPPRREPGRSAEPGQRKRAAARPGERGTARGVPRRRRADRPLLRQASSEQGRARAVRGSSRRRCEGSRRRLRRLPRGARAIGSAAHALHRAAGAPAPREADPAGPRDRGAVDLPGGVRDGRRRGCGGGLAPARREPLRSCGDRRRHLGRVSGALPRPDQLHDGRLGRPRREADPAA